MSTNHSLLGQNLILSFIDGKAYLCNQKPLSLDQIGLQSFSKALAGFAYWEIKVLDYIEEDQRIYVEILSYHEGQKLFSYQQLKLASELEKIESISFQSIDTLKVFSALSDSLDEENLSNNHQEDVFDKYAPREVGDHQLIKRTLEKIVIKESFYVSLKHVKFELGKVTFEKKFKSYPEKIALSINNYEIREEFDAIKNYFANVLGTKRIEVLAHIVIENGAILHQELRSPQIDKINKDLIESVKFEFVGDTQRKRLAVDIDKSLFTMDEYFDTLADGQFKSNTFHQNEMDLLEDLIHISKSKHFKYLRFLSSIHAHNVMKLRFVLQPFSFIFLVEGERNYHLVWETLDTAEATYIWHTDKNLPALKQTVRKIEDIINTIKVQGKIAYINSNEDAFRRIFHDYSNLVDGFVKWKGQLESYLT